MTTELKVEGMMCEACVKHVTNALQEVPGVTTSQVNLEAGTASVQHEGADVQTMIHAIEEEGYKASASN